MNRNESFTQKIWHSRPLRSAAGVFKLATAVLRRVLYPCFVARRDHSLPSRWPASPSAMLFWTTHTVSNTIVNHMVIWYLEHRKHTIHSDKDMNAEVYPELQFPTSEVNKTLAFFFIFTVLFYFYSQGSFHMPVVSWALTTSTVWNLQLSCFESSHMQPQVSHTAGRVGGGGCDPSSQLPVLWPRRFRTSTIGSNDLTTRDWKTSRVMFSKTAVSFSCSTGHQQREDGSEEEVVACLALWHFSPCITRGQWGLSVRIHSKSLACWADLTPALRPGNKQSGQWQAFLRGLQIKYRPDASRLYYIDSAPTLVLFYLEATFCCCWNAELWEHQKQQARSTPTDALQRCVVSILEPSQSQKANCKQC